MTSEATNATTPPDLLDAVATATARLLDTAGKLTDGDVHAPSLLPGWTRGHVLTHLARNADSLVNLLLWARTGIETSQYASQFIRDRDIEAGAPRPIAEQLADNETSADRWLGFARDMPAENWQAHVVTRGGRDITADQIPWMRLQEVEIHHVDLAADYRPSDWPAAFVAHLLPECAADLSRTWSPESPGCTVHTMDNDLTATIGAGTPTHTVSGTASSVLAWLLGRSNGADLTGELPDLPAWR